MDTAATIRTRLEAALEPSEFELIDESHKHAGHAGNTGGSHFRLRIVSTAFEGKGLVDRQRLVYGELGDVMGGAVHALAMTTLTPEEAAERSGA